MRIGRFKKLLIWTFVAAFSLSGFLAIFLSPKEAKAYTYPSGVISNTQSAPLSNGTTIQTQWVVDFPKIYTDVLHWDLNTIGNPDVEVKFLISIDGKVLDTKSPDIVDGATGNTGGNAPKLNTYSTPYSDQYYDGFNGEVWWNQSPDYNTPFRIYGQYNDQKRFAATLIDNSTIPKIDGGKEKAKSHVYSISTILRINTDVDLVVPPSNISFSPNSNPATITHNAEWFRNKYFDGATNFFVVGVGETTMTGSGTDWTIHIPAYKGNGRDRPPLDFKLTHIINYQGYTVTPGSEFVFIVQTNRDNIGNLGIMVSDSTLTQSCDQNVAYPFASFVVIPGSGSTKDSISWDTGINADLWFAGQSLSNKPDKKPDKNVYYKMLEGLFNGGPFGIGKCPIPTDLNDAAKKMLATDANNINQTQGDDTCGVTGGGWTAQALAKVLCVILRAMGGAGQWLINNIFGTVFNAYHPPSLKLAQTTLNPFVIQKAHAATDDKNIIGESAIKQALDGNPPWVLKSWKIILGLADVFVVIVLLFLAITNILHIQYDTYAIKKSLPTLIFGVILANFSVFITKMLVDACNALTATFIGNDAGTQLSKLITAVVPANGTFMPTSDIWTLLVAIFFAFFAIIAFLILGFLFYIRYIVILALTVAAPLAFVLMAFPPTQGIFKQWWGWYAKFIFMKPISFFFIWLASMVLEAQTAGGQPVGITLWALTVFLVCAAIIIPFKLGGAVMGAWGKAGKWLASPVTGAAKRAYEGKRDAWKERANLAAERYTPLGRWRMQHEETMTGLKAERERRKDELKEQRREKLGGLEETREARRERAKKDLERGKQERTKDFYETPEGEKIVEEEIKDAMAAGKLKQTKEDRTFDIYISGKAAEMGIPDYEASIANSEMRLEKIKDDQRYVTAYEKLNEHKKFTDSNPDLNNAFQNIETAQMELSMAKPHEQAVKQAALDTAQTKLNTQKAAAVTSLTSQENPETGRNYTTDEANKFIDSVRLQKYQQTRYYAITGKRQADDAATDAENYSPEATGADLYTKSVDSATGRLVVKAKAEGIAYGPLSAKQADIIDFTRTTVVVDSTGNPVIDPATGKAKYKAVRLSNAGASGAIKGKVNVWRKQMRDRTMKGAALQEYSNFLSIGNNQLLEAATHQAWTAVSGKTKDEIIEQAINNGIVPEGTESLDATQLATLIKEHGLNTGEINQNAFADALLSQLQKADGGTAIEDAVGDDVHGVTGLGQAAHWHAMNQ